MLLFGESHPGDPAFDLAVSHALLRRVGDGALPPLARVYRPGPTMAFGRLDALGPGFERACDAARAHGYTPAVRLGGGHAAGYDAGCVIVERIERNTTIAEGIEARFAAGAEWVAAALRDAGVPAQAGELPGEYCAGRFSVHGGGVKLAGTAQRSIRGAALMTAVVVVQDGARLRAALTDVYAALGIDWDPATAGAAEDLVPGLTAVDLQRAAVAALGPVQVAELDAATLALAAELRRAHEV